MPFLTTSRLIPADNFEDSIKQKELVETLIPVLDDSQLPLIFVVGTFFFEDDEETSVNPVWRKSLWHVCISSLIYFYAGEIEPKNATAIGYSFYVLELQYNIGGEA